MVLAFARLFECIVFAVKMRQSPARERSQLPGSPTTVDEQVLAGDVASRIADEQ